MIEELIEKFDEEKHPRDDRGRFSSGGSSNTLEVAENFFRDNFEEVNPKEAFANKSNLGSAWIKPDGAIMNPSKGNIEHQFTAEAILNNSTEGLSGVEDGSMDAITELMNKTGLVRTNFIDDLNFKIATFDYRGKPTKEQVSSFAQAVTATKDKVKIEAFTDVGNGEMDLKTFNSVQGFQRWADSIVQKSVIEDLIEKSDPHYAWKSAWAIAGDASQKFASSVKRQAKKLKPAIAQAVSEELSTKKARVPDSVAKAAVKTGMKLTPQMEDAYNKAVLSGYKVVAKVVSDRLGKKVSPLAILEAAQKRAVSKEFNEEDHPRDENGRFTSGGGASQNVSNEKLSYPINQSIPKVKIKVGKDGSYSQKELDDFIDSIPGDSIPMTHETLGKEGVMSIFNSEDEEELFASIGWLEKPTFATGENAYRVTFDVPKKELLFSEEDSKELGAKYSLKIDKTDHGESGRMLGDFTGYGGAVVTPLKAEWVNSIEDSNGHFVPDLFRYVKKNFEKSFNEEDHPRDENGRFASSSGASLSSSKETISTALHGLNLAIFLDKTKDRETLKEYRASTLDKLSSKEVAREMREAATKTSNQYSGNPVLRIKDAIEDPGAENDDERLESISDIVAGKVIANDSESHSLLSVSDFAVYASRIDSIGDAESVVSEIKNEVLQKKITDSFSYFGKTPEIREKFTDYKNLPNAYVDKYGIGSKGGFEERFTDIWTLARNNPEVVEYQVAAKELWGSSKTSIFNEGGRIGDIEPNKKIVDGLRDVYEKTQKALSREEYTLYRGTFNKVSKPSPLESWTQDKKIADKFAFTLGSVQEKTVPKEAVFGTYDNLKGWNENIVIGEKEFILIGELVGKSTEKSFDPSQPRAEDGKWTSGGGSGGKAISVYHFSDKKIDTLESKGGTWFTTSKYGHWNAKGNVRNDFKLDVSSLNLANEKTAGSLGMYDGDPKKFSDNLRAAGFDGAKMKQDGNTVYFIVDESKATKGSVEKASPVVDRSGLYAKLQERGTNMITSIAQSKQKQVVGYIEDLADQGYDPDEISDMIDEEFDLPLEPWEAKRIAVTETAWAVNQGVVQAATDLGLDKFTVLLDPDACQECLDAFAGGVAGEQAGGLRFGADSGVFSGDYVEGELPVHPNCRCLAQPVIGDDIDSLSDLVIDGLG